MDNVMNTLLENVKAEPTLNRENDVLPYGYFNPDTEGKLVWMCGEDADGKITSVFCFENENGRKEKSCKYLDTFEEAKNIRDELIKNNWRKLVPPKIEFTMPDKNNQQKPLNRAQKRYLAKKLENLNNENTQ
jgi:hypothetical protein